MVSIRGTEMVVNHGDKRFIIREPSEPSGYRFHSFMGVRLDGDPNKRPKKGQTIYAVVDVALLYNRDDPLIRGSAANPIAAFSDRATAEAFRDGFVKADPNRFDTFEFRDVGYEVYVRRNERDAVLVWEVKPKGDSDA